MNRFIKRFTNQAKRCAAPFAIVFALLLAPAACSRDPGADTPAPEEPPVVQDTATAPTPDETPEAPPEEPDVPDPEPEPETPPPEDGPANPYTGLPCDEGLVGKRPYAIMINNISAALPLLGVSKADIIYEIAVEGGVTRMMAIFQDVSEVGLIGSLRSAREYYVDIAQSYDAIYIFAGGSPQAYTALWQRNITRLDGVNGAQTQIFYRDQQRSRNQGFVHSLVTTGELITKWLPTYDFRMDHDPGYEHALSFVQDGAPSTGSPAMDFSVRVSSSKSTSFRYDDEGLYKLSQFGRAMTDGNDGSQVSVTNILVLKTAISRIPGDGEGRLQAATTGKGNGYFACGGKYVEIEWSRANDSSQFTYKQKDGAPLALGQGMTYVCLVSDGTDVEIK